MPHYALLYIHPPTIHLYEVDQNKPNMPEYMDLGHIIFELCELLRLVLPLKSPKWVEKIYVGADL